MRIEIENIGKIASADIIINGITVIGGKNGTGKSTISRSLFTMFNSFHNYRSRIRLERINSISRLSANRHKAESIADNSSLYINDKQALIDLLLEGEEEEDVDDFIKENGSYYKADPSIINERAEAIQERLQISDKAILDRLIRRGFDQEFNDQPLNIYSDSKGLIKLHIKDKVISVSIDGKQVDSEGEFELSKNAIYIDDPFIIDSLSMHSIIISSKFLRRSSQNYVHSAVLKKILENGNEQNSVESIISDKKLEKIYNMLNSVCPGTIINQASDEPLISSGYSYIEDNSDKKLNIKNLSSGLKTFVLLKKLIENGALQDNGVLIFDEPEIHLHPEWQLVLAELIILIQKEYNMHILINTHSPYFLDAIEAYSVRHSIKDKCTFYLASNDGKAAVFEDVSENIDRIYQLLAAPFQELENIRQRSISDES